MRIDAGESYRNTTSVPATPISEGAGPFPYWLAPCQICTRPARIEKKKIIIEKKKKKLFLFLQNAIAVFVFSDSRCKNACKMLADLCPCFHQSPTRPNFGRSCVKVCPILCRLRTKLCPNFARSRARLCPISFAPCPFPNLAGTLVYWSSTGGVGVLWSTYVPVAASPPDSRAGEAERASWRTGGVWEGRSDR